MDDARLVGAAVRKAMDAVDAIRRRKREEHGLCHLDVRAKLLGESGRIRVLGTVLVDRLRDPVLEAFRDAFGPSWTVSDGMRVVQGGSWHVVSTPVDLMARRSTKSAGAPLLTRVLPEDGPLELLGVHAGAHLLRAQCGTAGWSARPLGARCTAPELDGPEHVDPALLVKRARRWRGVSYSLGGVGRAGVDCSGLVQRVARRGLGVVLPRHSADQWGIGAQKGPPPGGRGHLVFAWTTDEAACHVGIATGEHIIHASASRGRVVEDPCQTFFARASRLEHVPFAAILAFARRCQGAPNLLASGVRLGFDGDISGLSAHCEPK